VRKEVIYIILALIILGLIPFTIYISKMENKAGYLKEVTLYAIIPTLVLIGLIELILIPNWGVEKISSGYPLFTIIWIFGLLQITNQIKNKYN
jgi:hypothetical protein